MPDFNVTSMITRLLSIGQPDKGLTRSIKEDEILTLCGLVREQFQKQGSLVEINPPVIVCGDTHGQFNDVLRLFERGGFPATASYLFLGDYVDRGRQNLETILLLFCYKLKYPQTFFLLRGNHECAHVNKVYGFLEECNRRYQSQRMWESFQDVFQWMPLSALVGERILCMHGGLSPTLKNFDQLRNLERPTEASTPGLTMDLLWADPVIGQQGFLPNMRGASFGFGPDALAQMCKELDIDLASTAHARAHQVVQDGYEFFGGRKLVTIFSAPHYCGQFDNAAAMMRVDEHMNCSFIILRPSETRGAPKIIPTPVGRS